MTMRSAFGGMLALAIGMGVGRFAYTPILPLMQAQTGLGDQEAGLLASANFAGYLLGALLARGVPPGAGRTRLFRLGLLLSLATTAGMAATTALAPWAVLRLLSGLASAGIFILGNAIVLDRLAAAGQERLAALTFAGVGLGIAASGAAVALSEVPWRGEWLSLAAASAVLAVPAWAWVADPPAAPKPAGGKRGLSLPAGLLPLAVAYFCEGAGYSVTGTFMVAVLARMPETAAYGVGAWIVVGLAAMVSMPLWAALGGRLGLPATLILAHLVQAVAILLPVAATGGGPALAGAVGFGGTFVAIASLTLILGRRLAPGDSSGVIGLLTAIYAVGQAVGPLAAGIALERTGRLDLPLISAAVLVLAGAGFVALSAARAPKAAA